MDLEFLRTELQKLNELKRNHADYFEWHDKAVKELNIGLAFFRKLEELGSQTLRNIDNAEDPPDVKVTVEGGDIIGVEITELVDQKAIELEIKKDSNYCFHVVGWDEKNTLEAIQRIITEKDSKCRAVPEYYETVSLLIFTDEPKLPIDTLDRYLKSYQPIELKNIDNVYILTGYDPKHGDICLRKIQ